MSQTTKVKTKSRKVGSLLDGKDGGFYIKFAEPVEFIIKDAKGKEKRVKSQFLNVDKPADIINRLVQFGALTADQAEERLNKLPSFVRYELSVSVPQE